MAKCTCPPDLNSLSQLCANCKAEFLTVCADGKLQDEAARRYGCTPETLGLTITQQEAQAIEQTNARDSYEPATATHELRLDTHARRIADVEMRMKAQAETLRTLQAAVRALVAIAIDRRPA